MRGGTQRARFAAQLERQHRDARQARAQRRPGDSAISGLEDPDVGGDVERPVGRVVGINGDVVDRSIRQRGCAEWGDADVRPNRAAVNGLENVALSICPKSEARKRNIGCPACCIAGINTDLGNRAPG